MTCYMILSRHCSWALRASLVADNVCDQVLMQFTLFFCRQPKDRQDLVDTFQSNPSVRVALLGLTAAGIGITLTAASRCVLAGRQTYLLFIADDCQARMRHTSLTPSAMSEIRGYLSCWLTKTLVGMPSTGRSTRCSGEQNIYLVQDSPVMSQYCFRGRPSLV